MTLKTLEDINLCKYFDYCVHPDLKCKEECFHQEIRDDIKQLAIDRIKYWQKFPQSASVGELVNEMQIWGRIAELKDFLNITGEDLK